MPSTANYQNPQFLLYALTFLMLTPSPLQQALLGAVDPDDEPSSLPKEPLPPFDKVEPGDVQDIQNVLSSLGFQNPGYVWTEFGAYLVHLTQPGIRDTLRSVLFDVLDDAYIGDPPCPPVPGTQAVVKALESLAQAQADPAMMQRLHNMSGRETVHE